MFAVAGSRSRPERTISVRPPLSSVISRNAYALTRSSPPRCTRGRVPGRCGNGHWNCGNCGRITPPGPRGRRPPGNGARNRRLRDGGARRRRGSRTSSSACPSIPIAYTITSDSRISCFTSPSDALTVGVVAIGDQHDRALAMLAGLRQRNRLGDRVEHRGAAIGADSADRAAETSDDLSSSPARGRGRC